MPTKGINQGKTEAAIKTTNAATDFLRDLDSALLDYQSDIFANVNWEIGAPSPTTFCTSGSIPKIQIGGWRTLNEPGRSFNWLDDDQDRIFDPGHIGADHLQYFDEQSQLDCQCGPSYYCDIESGFCWKCKANAAGTGPSELCNDCIEKLKSPTKVAHIDPDGFVRL